MKKSNIKTNFEKNHNDNKIMKAFFHGIPDMFFLISPEFVILDYYCQEENQLYVSPEIFLNKKIQDVLPQPVSEKFQENITQAFESEKVILFVYNLTMPDGEHYYECRLKKVEDQKTCIAVSRDVTEQYLYRKKLTDSEERYSRLVERAPIAALVYNKNDNRIEYLNKRGSMLLGINSENQNQIYLKDIFCDAMDYQKFIESFKNDNAVREVEVALRTQNNQIIWSLISAADLELKTEQTVMMAIKDITKRKKAELELRKEHEMLTQHRELEEALYLMSSNSICISDCMTGKILEFNDVAYEFLGYDKEEFSKLYVSDILVEESKELAIVNTKLAEEGEIVNFIGKHRSKDGSIKEVSVSTRNIMRENRLVCCSVSRDITEHRNREREQQALTQKLYLYNDLIRQISSTKSVVDGNIELFPAEITELLGNRLELDRISIWMYRSHGNYLECLDLYTYRTGEHRKGFRILKSENPDFFQEMSTKHYVDISENTTDEEIERFHSTYMKENGLLTLLTYSISFNGKDVGMIAFADKTKKESLKTDDIAFCGLVAEQIEIALTNHERMEITKNLQKKESILNHAQAVAGTGNWFMDFKTEEFTWSEEVYSIFHIDRRKPMNQETFMEYVDWGDKRKVKEAIRHASQGTPFSLLHKTTVKGNVRWISEHAEIIYDQNKNPVSCIGIVQDVTEKLINEKELMQYRQNLEAMVISRTAQLETAKQAAESANLAKSAFLSNMSHEIRTPMNAIFGYAQLLQKENLSSNQLEQLDKLMVSAKHLLRIINDILDFSKIEAGKVSLENQNFEPARIIDQICKMVVEEVKAKKLSLEVDLEDIPLVVNGDSHHLSQILLNLINNAVKFTRVGKIIVKGQVSNLSNEKVSLRFSVTDTGIGMTKEQMNRIFKDFQQADDSTTRVYGGTGLGLAISKRLCNLMGGTIGVESQVGVGSTFWTEIPFTISQITPKNMLNMQSLTGMPVLVIDDQETDRDIMVSMLSHIGLRPEIAGTAREALDIISRGEKAGIPYQFLFLDMKMPDMNGIEFINKLKNKNLNYWPIIIVTTAYMNEFSGISFEDLPIAKTLEKPITPSSLVDCLTSLSAENEEEIPIDPGELESDLAKRRGSKLLLVDDNSINLDVNKQILESIGMNVDLAENGFSAVEKVKSKAYDLIFMDIQMPVMDGFQATKAIRLLDEGSKIPIIAMTANAFDEDSQKCLAGGMNGHLSKPVEIQKLYETLIHWLSEKSIEQPEEESMNAMEVDSDIQQELTKIPSLDVKYIDSVFHGNLQAYKKLVKQFIEHHEEDSERIQNALNMGDFKQLAFLAHALKGVAASLGILNVWKEAADLETLVKEGGNQERLQLKQQQLKLQLEKMMGYLKELVSAPENQRTQISLSAGHSSMILLRLESLLKIRDASVNDVFEEFKVDLVKTYGDKAIKLENQIQEFNYQEALELVVSMAKEFELFQE